mmetsp:Transcript_56370/g.132168  ORF Transcript_56370/g.132168 Transcript_56370/m.132168 type:complete len:1057 (+) Transcript_56370:78-3248(+)
MLRTPSNNQRSSSKMGRTSSSRPLSSLVEVSLADFSRGESCILNCLERLVESHAATHKVVMDMSVHFDEITQISELLRRRDDGSAEMRPRFSQIVEILPDANSSGPMHMAQSMHPLSPTQTQHQSQVAVAVGAHERQVSGMVTGTRSAGHPAASQFETFSSEGESADNESMRKSSVAPLLSRLWPKDLVPLAIASSDMEVPRSRQNLDLAHLPMSESRIFQEALDEQGPDWQIFVQKFLVMDPNSRVHMLYDMISLIVLFYDLTVIPFLLAWDMVFEGAIQFISVCTVVFWTFDVSVNMLTAITVDGRLQKNLGMIFRSYLRTWLVLDLTIVVSDWGSMILTRFFADENSKTGGSVKILRLAKLSRLVRILAMFRILKFVRVMEDFLDRTAAEGYRLAIKIVAILMVIAWVTHMISCGWFAVGRLPSDTGLHWTDSNSFLDISSEEPVYQYFASLHWAVAQVTLGSMGIACLNSFEHSFNVVCLIFGLLFGSTLISSLSATMVQFQMLRNGRAQKMQMLRKFLQDYRVDLHISFQVQKQIQDRLQSKEKLSDKDVPELRLLSASLFADLKLAMYQRHICQHALFNLWFRLDPSRFKRLCVEGLDYTSLRPGDELFQPGVQADACAYIFVEGTVKYEQDPSSSPVKHNMAASVEKNAVICEAALWSQWVHVGKVTATGTTASMVLKVEGEEVSALMKFNIIVADIIRQYAQNFHRRIVSACPPRADYPTDLHVPYTDFEDLVISMDMENQITIGLNALADFHMEVKRWRGNRAGLVELRTEVEAGKSVVLVNGSGEVQRVVSVVALKLCDEQDNIFVQLGKLEKGKVVFSGQLPGSKQQRGELTAEAVQRILDSRLAPLTSCVEFAETSRSREQKESKNYGVRTKYLRTVCRLKLTQAFSIPFVNTETLEPPRPTPEHHVPTSSMPVFGNFRPDATKHYSTDSTARLSLASRFIYLIEESETTCFYAWLSEEEFKNVNTNEDTVLRCLQQVWDKFKQLHSVGEGSVSVAARSFAVTQSRQVRGLSVVPGIASASMSTAWDVDDPYVNDEDADSTFEI